LTACDSVNCSHRCSQKINVYIYLSRIYSGMTLQNHADWTEVLFHRKQWSCCGDHITRRDVHRVMPCDVITLQDMMRSLLYNHGTVSLSCIASCDLILATCMALPGTFTVALVFAVWSTLDEELQQSEIKSTNHFNKSSMRCDVSNANG
jgi:hypothetical protein